MQAAWRVISTTIVAALAALKADFAHFTWWSIALWGIYGLLEEFSLGKKIFWFFESIQILVIAGVVIMGADDCSVFEEAFADLGPTAYIAGNFAMHYLPSLVVLGFATDKHIFCGETAALTQVWTAFGLFLIWHHLKDPWDVYGCSLPHALGVMGMLVMTIALSLFAQQWSVT